MGAEQDKRQKITQVLSFERPIPLTTAWTPNRNCVALLLYSRSISGKHGLEGGSYYSSTTVWSYAFKKKTTPPLGFSKLIYSTMGRGVQTSSVVCVHPLFSGESVRTFTPERVLSITNIKGVLNGRNRRHQRRHTAFAFPSPLSFRHDNDNPF